MHSLKKFSFFLVLLTVFCLLFVSCDAPSHGIFYTLDNEVTVSQSDSNLPQESAFFTISSYNNNILVSGSSMYISKTDGTAWSSVSSSAYIPMEDWVKVDLPDTSTDSEGNTLGKSVVTSLVLDTYCFILAVGNNTDATSSIYRSSFNYSTASDVDWDEIEFTLGTNERYYNIFKIDSDIIMETRTAELADIDDDDEDEALGYTYKLYILNNPSTSDAGDLAWSAMTALNSAISSAGTAYSPLVSISKTSGSSEYYWFVQKSKVFKSTSVSGSYTAVSLSSTFPTSPYFTNSYADGAMLYLLSGKGYVARVNANTAPSFPSAWDVSDTYYPSSSTLPVGFSTVTRVTMKDLANSSSSSTKSYLIFGTIGDDARNKSYGLYWLDESLSSLSSDDSLVNFELDNGNYTSTQLKKQGINYLYFDSSNSNASETPLYACTPQNGLYSALYRLDDNKDDPSLWWTQE